MKVCQLSSCKTFIRAFMYIEVYLINKREEEYDRCPQVTIEAIADWYFSHEESYGGIKIPEDLTDTFNEWAEDEKHYFDD